MRGGGSCQGEAKVIISLQRKFYQNEHREIRNRDREVKEQREDHHLWKGMVPKTSWTYSNVFSLGGSSAEMDCS